MGRAVAEPRRRAGRRPRRGAGRARAHLVLARTFYQLGEIALSIRHAEDALELFEQLMGNHLRTLNARFALGDALIAGGRIEEGLNHLFRCKELSEDSLDPAHPMTLVFYGAPADGLLAAGRPEAALVWAQKIVALAEAQDQKHRLLEDYTRLGETHRRLKQLDQARFWLARALALSSRGEDSAEDIAPAYIAWSRLELDLGAPERAAPAAQHGLDLLAQSEHLVLRSDAILAVASATSNREEARRLVEAELEMLAQRRITGLPTQRLKTWLTLTEAAARR